MAIGIPSVISIAYIAVKQADWALTMRSEPWGMAKTSAELLVFPIYENKWSATFVNIGAHF